MLVQMVSALGLLAVSTVVVDLVMVYLMPHRLMYFEEKFQVTRDFHPDTHTSDAAGPSGDLNISLARERLLSSKT